MYKLIKRIPLFIVIVTIGIFLSGCESQKLNSRYQVSLIQVDQPKNPKEQYGTQRISTTNEQGKYEYAFEDNLIQVFWVPQTDEIEFSLKNKTKNTMKILWDDASLITYAGSSERVIHAGIKYSEKSSPQAPSVIAKGSTLSDLIAPASYISYSSLAKAWVSKPLLPPYQVELGFDEKNNGASSNITIPDKIQISDIRQSGYSSLKASFWYTDFNFYYPYTDSIKGLNEIEQITSSLIGKRFSVVLPIQIEGVTNEYTFTFNIDDFYFKLQKK